MTLVNAFDYTLELLLLLFERLRQITADIDAAHLSVEAQIAAAAAAPEAAAAAVLSQPLPHDDNNSREEESGGAGGAGTDYYVDRLKAAVLDCVDTAKRAPESFEEALAVIKGERAVKPDYGRAVSTVSAVSWSELGCG